MNKNEIVGVLFVHNTFHIIHFCLSKELVHLSGAKTPPPPPRPSRPSRQTQINKQGPVNKVGTCWHLLHVAAEDGAERLR